MGNILICSAGRRVELVQAFCEQVRRFIPGSVVHAIDCYSELSSACQVANYSSSCPQVDDPNYINFLLEYSRKHEISLVIPTIDTELILLAAEKDRFKKQGVDIVVSSTKLVDLCRDKRKTASLFKILHIDYPIIFAKEAIEFPCFMKPYNGSCSVGARKIASPNELTENFLHDETMMFMQLVDTSYAEVTVDAYFSDGELKCLVPRKRLEVRSGEVSKGLIIKSWLYDQLKMKLSYIEGASGCLTIQVFANDQKRHCIGLEINPRFGGGFPLSYAAGANFPGWLICEYILGDSIPFFEEWETDMLMLRYDAKVLVRNVQLV